MDEQGFIILLPLFQSPREKFKKNGKRSQVQRSELIFFG
jgi:hypothetical protein